MEEMEEMEEGEYLNELQSIFLLARLARPIRASDVLRAMEHAETIGPILHPTLYKKAARGVEWQKRLVRATVLFQQAIERIASSNTPSRSD